MNKIRSGLQKLEIKHLVLILAVTETLHNTEEAILFSSGSSTLTKWQTSVGVLEFRIAIILLTFLIYGVMYYSMIYDTQFSSYVFSGMVTMILINVFVPQVTDS